jgi:hypothetical protein
MGFPKAQWLTSSSLPAFRSAGHVTPRIFMLSGISQEKLPVYLGFFQFVHNTRQRGKALLGALVAALVA